MTRKTGRIEVGAPVTVPQGALHGAIRLPLAAMPTSAERRFICRGCYYVYEEAQGLPQLGLPPGTPFAALPHSWQCPDCGTDKTTFRPLVLGDNRAAAEKP